MRRITFLFVAASLAALGCSDGPAAPVAADVPSVADAGVVADASEPTVPAADAGRCGAVSSADVLVQLRALEGVEVTEKRTENALFGYRYFTLRFTQPVDHEAPGGATFTQQVSLLHHDLTSPMIAYTTGYDDYYLDNPTEPTALLGTNQISIEHRYYGSSVPSPLDWSKLTAAQMAADEHEIVSKLRCVYRAPWVSSGGSKGALSALFHRQRYPDDVAGTIAYSAPMSHGTPDHRYDSFIDGVTSATCRDAVRAAAKEMLQHRRTALLALADAEAKAKGDAYTQIALGPALEGAILGLEWSFWTDHGVSECSTVPAPSASDDALFTFLSDVSPVNGNDDSNIAWLRAWYYEGYSEIGLAGTPRTGGVPLVAALTPWLQYGDADYVGKLPPQVPKYDPAPIADLEEWVQKSGNHLVFIYGQNDPWSATKVKLGNAQDALEVTVRAGKHASGIGELSSVDRSAVLAKIASWIAPKGS